MNEGTKIFLGVGGVALTFFSAWYFIPYKIKYPRVSSNFTWDEFQRSQVAISQGIKAQFHPPLKAMKNGRKLAKKILQPLRNYIQSPIIVNSWYRSPELNSELINLGYPAAVNSTHLTGGTADVRAQSIENRFLAIYAIILNLPFDRMLLEFGNDSNPDWIQFEYNGQKSDEQQRRQIIRITEGTSGYSMSADEVLALYQWGSGVVPM
jgi:hypothetical protein